MGSWGPGVFQNDHALDLFSIEVDDLGEGVEAALDEKDASWTDIEGPLIYVHLLGVLAQQHSLGGLEAATVKGWRDRYLEIYDSSLGRAAATASGKARRAVIVKTFATLLGRLDDDDDEPAKAKPPTKSKSKKSR